MQHPFTLLRPEYEHLLAIMQVTRGPDVDGVARKLLRVENRFVPVSAATGVPVVVLATFCQRESGCDFSKQLGQGDPLTHPSIHVPRGRPPLGAPPNDRFPVSWEYAAIDAVRYDHLDDNSAPWDMAYACWKGEAWNGFGPRNHGRHTGYLWGGTTIYDGGKYVADGMWDPHVQDRQLGIVPVMLRMIELMPALQFGTPIPSVSAPALVPEPMPTPEGVGHIAAIHDVHWIQRTLNALGYGPLLEDGNYGRRTREAIRGFQGAHGLTADGLAGTTQTIPALAAAVAAKA